MEQSVTATRVWTTAEKQIIHEFTSRVRNAFEARAQKIILYGSRARGDADEESDYDFLILVDEVRENDKSVLQNISWEISFDFSVLVVARLIGRSNFTEDRYFYFHENVCREGIEL